MKRLCLALMLMFAVPAHAEPQPPFPVVYGWHFHVELDGTWHYVWYQVTPRDGYSGWVRDPQTDEIVHWKWVDGRVVIWRTRS